jgi:hypothetical protein
MVEAEHRAQAIERAISRARGAITDGRVENWAFKHKQLASLFGECSLVVSYLTGSVLRIDRVGMFF